MLRPPPPPPAHLPSANDARTALRPIASCPNTPTDAAGSPLLTTKCSNPATPLMPPARCRASYRSEVLKWS